MQQEQLFIYMVRIIVLFTALPVHECAHALVASKLGDNTAKERGRLSLNPFLHLDIIGSVLLVFVGFGWAKPVPVDMRNFKHPRRGMAISALAGPMSNIIMAYILFCVQKVMFYTLSLSQGRISSNMLTLYTIVGLMASINLSLAVLNLLPVPPLDGSKIIGGILPEKLYYGMLHYERYIAMFVFLAIWSGLLSKPLNIMASGLLNVLDILSRPIDWIFL